MQEASSSPNARTEDSSRRAGTHSAAATPRPRSTSSTAPAPCRSPTSAAWLELAPDVGYALFQAGEFERARRILDDAIEQASASGDRLAERHAWVVRDYSRLFNEPDQIDLAEALRDAEASIELFEEAGDHAALSRAWNFVWHLYQCIGEAPPIARWPSGPSGLFIIAIDTDPATIVPSSRYPTPVPPGLGETPQLAIDGSVTTKYLNFGENNSGFIVTPSAASIIQSFIISTANDAEERDPATYALFGTNAPITSTDNSQGMAEAWTLIQEGAVTLPSGMGSRQVPGTPVDTLNNTTSFNSYKLIFPTVRNPATANSMQLSEVQFYSDVAGAGNTILSSSDTILAVDHDPPTVQPNSRHPAQEGPPQAIDANAGSKYLNFGKENSGFIVTLAPANQTKVVKSMQLTTANDAPGRDPARYEIWGTNSPITSTNNSQGMGAGENWTLISSGTISLPGDPAVGNSFRGVTGEPIPFPNNTTAYASYKVIFPDNKADVANADSIQFAEVQFHTEVPRARNDDPAGRRRDGAVRPPPPGLIRETSIDCTQPGAPAPGCFVFHPAAPKLAGMQTRKLGNSDVHVTPVIFGAWAIGGWMWGDQDDADVDRRHPRSRSTAGVTTIDTAAIYGMGQSEELVAKAIAGRPRDKFVIATKCGRALGLRPRLRPVAARRTRLGRMITIRNELAAGVDHLRVRAVPQAPQDGLHRPVPDPLARQDHAGRGLDGGDGEAEGAGKDPRDRREQLRRRVDAGRDEGGAAGVGPAAVQPDQPRDREGRRCRSAGRTAWR